MLLRRGTDGQGCPDSLIDSGTAGERRKKQWVVSAWLLGGGGQSVRWRLTDALRVKSLHEAGAGAQDHDTISQATFRTYARQPGATPQNKTRMMTLLKR